MLTRNVRKKTLISLGTYPDGSSAACIFGASLPMRKPFATANRLSFDAR